MISPDDGFTPEQIARVRREADPWLRAALRKGMLAGLAIGATLATIGWYIALALSPR